MRKFILGLAALPFAAGVAFAAEPLSDAQLDRVVAGATSTIELSDLSLPPIMCPGCTSSAGNTTGSSNSGTQPTSGASSAASACPGCTGGQTFSVGIGQPVFSALIQFLTQTGYTPQ